MTRAHHVLAIDQGTTSTRCIVFDEHARSVSTAQREFQQHYPASGWVEHNAEDIWRDTLATARAAIEQSGVGADGIAALGITNQRETTVVWERASGVPIHRAIVWQDRRTADVCAALKRDGVEDMVRQRTGLLLDPYFSATKLEWMLEHRLGASNGARDLLAAATSAGGVGASWNRNSSATSLSRSSRPPEETIVSSRSKRMAEQRKVVILFFTTEKA